MDVKEAAKLAKDYVADLFAEEGIGNLGLEEIELVADGHYWVVTVGFSRPWDQRHRKKTYVHLHHTNPWPKVRKAQGAEPAIRNFQNRRDGEFTAPQTRR